MPRPVPRTDTPRPAGALPLAGSAQVWFLPEAGAPAALATPRPVLPGLPSDRPLVMGIINVTPDSFSDGGTLAGVADALLKAQAMVAAGADILDIGGESTRPGAAEVPVTDEIARTAPVIRAIRAAGITTPISIDTRKARVAEAALAAGADMVNDVSALTWDADLAGVVVAAGVPLCLMHAQGTPQTMQRDPCYDDVVAEVYEWLARRMEHATAAGIAPERLIADVGIGFGKTLAHNLGLLRALVVFHGLGAPILLGASRKRMIGELTGEQQPDRRMSGSVAAALWAAAQGAQILRVHDVAETVQALGVWRAMTLES